MLVVLGKSHIRTIQPGTDNFGGPAAPGWVREASGTL
jgi:hypothetical protein